MTLADFLFEHIAKDESLAAAAEGWFESTDWSSGAAADFGETFDPARVLTECQLKRQIVTEHWDNNGCDVCADGAQGCDGYSWKVRAAYPCLTLKLIALPYVDHPDFDPAWAVTADAGR